MRAKEIERRQQQSLRAETPAVQDCIHKAAAETSKSSAAKDVLHSEKAASRPNTSPVEDTVGQRERRFSELQSLREKEDKVLGNQSPLDSSLLCEAVHQYICTTTSFINTYVADVNASLEGVDHKLRVLEDQMSLLEGRLGSIPSEFMTEENEETMSKNIDN